MESVLMQTLSALVKEEVVFYSNTVCLSGTCTAVELKHTRPVRQESHDRAVRVVVLAVSAAKSLISEFNNVQVTIKDGH